MDFVELTGLDALTVLCAVAVAVFITIGLSRDWRFLLFPGRAISGVPGPVGLPVIGNLHQFDPHQIHEALRSFHRQFGPVVGLRYGPQRMMPIADPALVEEILSKKYSKFTNSDLFRASFGSLFPTSVIVLENQDWKRVRRVLQTALSVGHNLPSLVPIVDRCLQSMFTTVIDPAFVKAGGRPVSIDLHLQVTRVLFDSFGRFGFGMEVNTLHGQHAELFYSLHVLLGAVDDRLHRPFRFLYKLPSAANRKVEKSLAYVKEVAESMILEKLDQMKGKTVASTSTSATSTHSGDSGAHNDLLSAMLHSSVFAPGGVTGDCLSREELLDNLSSFFIVAYDTTGNELAFALKVLSENPDIQDRIAAECAGLPASPSLADLAGLEYLDAVIRETLRLYPTGYIVPRTSLEDVTLTAATTTDTASDAGRSPLLVPRGTVCMLNVYEMGRQGDLWPHSERAGTLADLDDALLFRPDRWLLADRHRKRVELNAAASGLEVPESADERRRRFAFIPFGAGGRICLGQKIAMAEIRVILTQVCRRYRLRADPEHPVKPYCEFVLTVKDGVHVFCDPR